jgi:hypothetical protein
VQVPPVRLKSVAFVPLNPGGSVSETGLVWKLCTAIDVVFLEPIFTLPNAKLAGVTVMSTVPVPVAATCCGLLAVLSVTEIVALCGPSPLGVNPIAIVQLAKCASPPPGQVVPVSANSASFEVTLPTNSGCVPVFLTVRFLVTVSPAGELPIASDAGTEIEVVGVAVGVAVAVSVAVGVAVAV